MQNQPKSKKIGKGWRKQTPPKSKQYNWLSTNEKIEELIKKENGQST